MLIDGADVLTLSVFRGVVGVVLVAAWLKIGTTPVPHTPRARWNQPAGCAAARWIASTCVG